MLSLANAREQRRLPDVFEINRRKRRARLRTEIAGPHVADLPERLQPFGRIERDLRHLFIKLMLVPPLLTTAGLSGQQFPLACACAQQLLQQAIDPLGVVCR